MKRRLLVGMDKPVFLVVDGHPVHKSKTVREFAEMQNGRIKLFFLSLYPPHLNPDEVVWAHVKREVSRKLAQSKDEMKQFVLSALHRIQKLPNLVRSFFQQPDT